MPSYTCDTIANGFIAESGRFSGELYRKLAPSGPWLQGTPRGEWRDGMGKILNNILFERTVPATDNTAPGAASSKWVDEVFSDGGSNDACLPTPETLQWGQTSRPYQVQVRNLQTPEFCVEDLRSDYDIAMMIDALMSNLEWGTGYVWEDRNRHEYIRLCEHKVTETANAGFDIDGQTAFDLVNSPPTSRLTVGTLEWIYEQLEADGASLYSMGKTSMGRPIYDLYTDSVTARDLMRQDPNIRDDFRWAFSGEGLNSPLLQTLGAPWSWNGYRFIHDRFPERYNVVGGQAVRVDPFLDPQQTATKGYKQDRNPAYKFAQYQISVIHIPMVFKQLIKRPISQLGKFKFDPVKYTGDFQILRIPDKKCNPRGTKLFLDSIFASASEPGLTYLGWAIAHKNCPPLRITYPSCYS